MSRVTQVRIEDRTRTRTWFCPILTHKLSSFCYTASSQDLVSLTWGKRNNRPADQQTSLCLESKCPFPTFMESDGKFVFLCLLQESGWSCCFSPTWEALVSPGLVNRRGLGGRDGISSWPRWDHASFKMQIDTWRSKVPWLIPWAGGEN